MVSYECETQCVHVYVCAESGGGEVDKLTGI